PVENAQAILEIRVVWLDPDRTQQFALGIGEPAVLLIQIREVHIRVGGKPVELLGAIEPPDRFVGFPLLSRQAAERVGKFSGARTALLPVLQCLLGASELSVLKREDAIA